MSVYVCVCESLGRYSREEQQQVGAVSQLWCSYYITIITVSYFPFLTSHTHYYGNKQASINHSCTFVIDPNTPVSHFLYIFFLFCHIFMLSGGTEGFISYILGRRGWNNCTFEFSY